MPVSNLRAEPETPALSAIVVHWRDEGGVRDIARAWPTDGRFELIVVDNGSREPLDLPSEVQMLQPERNLGFAGAVNLGLRHTSAPLVLILNSDVRITRRALDEVVRCFALWPDTAGLAPRLVGEDGHSQHRWQLRRIPSGPALALQALWLATGDGPAREPEAGSAVEQPAAAALVLRRDVLLEIGGLDERFHPAWFEDVDLAVRLRAARHVVRYCPQAELVHALGTSVTSLGYGRFLRIYYANLCRYMAKHHGVAWVPVLRAALAVTALGRVVLLPLRTPRRAAGKVDAARGLAQLACWSIIGRPRPVPGS